MNFYMISAVIIKNMNILNISDAASIIDNRKVVFITGVTGQDGSHMVDYLLKNTDYMIFGGVRRLSVPNHTNLKDVDWNTNRFALVNFDLSDAHAINAIVKELKPDYFINLAAQTFVGSSWDFPVQTWECNTTGVIHILEAIRQHKPACRFYNAGCHSSDTRVLTPDGLKNYKEMKTGDLVYSINPKNKNLELKKITKLFEYDYNGELFEFKQGGLLVTPNHKMFYKTKSNNILVKNAEDFIKLADVKYPTNNPCKGNMLDEITDLSNFIPIQKKKGNKNYGKHVTKINTYDLMYLIGIYIGDGSCRIMKKQKKVTSLLETRIRNGIGQYVSDNNAVEFEVEYQCPQTIIDIPPTDVCFPKVIKTLERNNIKWKLYGKCDITMHQWGLVPYFSECGNSAVQKHIPSWIFDLDSSYQLKVLEGIRDSDGDDRDVISTVSPQLQFDLLKLHINCGIMPTFGERPSRTSVLKDGRQIKGNYPERWIHGLKENTGYQRGNYKKINYTGKVWCFEVEDNHNFIVERCGKLTFSGNSSEEYGNVEYAPQDEKHPSKPRSPYGASKSAARQLVKVYRESYKLYAVQGLLFNHEGTRRGEEFVTRKITKGVARIKKALLDNKSFNSIELGNVYAKRDWSDAEDFVDAIWRMLNQEKYRIDFDSHMQIQEYVVSSNETHTIKEFVELAFKTADINGVWHGNGLGEEYSISVADAMKYDPSNSVLVKINPKFYRPAEVDLLLGNSNLIRNELQWKPKTTFSQLVEKMVLNDLKLEGLE